MKSRVVGFWICLTSVLVSGTLFSQTSIAILDKTPISTSTSTQIVFSGDFVNQSAEADFSNATLILAGGIQALSNNNESAIVLGGIIVGGGGTKNLSGVWEVTGQITLNDGIVVPDPQAKFVHTITSGTTGDIVGASELSYVNGLFYSKGTGTRLFPIGNSGGYFPAQLFNVSQGDVEVGMEVLNQNARLSHGSDLLEVFNGQYWRMVDPSSTLVGPIIGLSSVGAFADGFITPGIGTVVIGGANTGGAGISLGGAASGDFIVSSMPLLSTDRIFTLGQISSEEVKLRIHNVVTPFLDHANDYLEIENIHVFPINKVTLLDRWGGPVKEWTNFTNVVDSPDSDYDLSKIAMGNYICVLEYKDGDVMKRLSQMVTIVNPHLRD